VDETFNQGTSYVPISVTRMGTFEQFGLGLTAQLRDSNWVGYVRGDYRTGENITGTTLNGGLRYRF